MKKYITLLIFLIPFVNVWAASFAEQRLSDAEIKSRINAAMMATTTITCDFVQTKHLKMLNEKVVSVGTMAFKQSDKLRWEYSSPYAYLFILNADKAYIKQNDKPITIINTDKNKAFRMIMKLMNDGISGKNLNDERNFRVEIQQKPNTWIVTLTPIRGNVRAMFRSITMHYDAKAVMVKKTEMLENNGDQTVIEFNNVNQNGVLSDDLFMVK